MARCTRLGAKVRHGDDMHCSCCQKTGLTEAIELSLPRTMLPAKFVRFCTYCAEKMAQPVARGKERRFKSNSRTVIMKRYESTKEKCYLSGKVIKGPMVALHATGGMCTICVGCVKAAAATVP